jgi:hypothetical protein
VVHQVLQVIQVRAVPQVLAVVQDLLVQAVLQE